MDNRPFKEFKMSCTHERCLRDNCLKCCFCGIELCSTHNIAEIGNSTNGSWALSPNFLPYKSEAKTPTDLCREMMIYAMCAEITENKKASEIKEALAFFFTAEQIERARSTLGGNKR